MRRDLLSGLGVLGWESLAPVIVAALATEAPLLLVEQTEEEDDGCLQLVGEGVDLRHQEVVHMLLTTQALLSTLPCVPGQVDVRYADPLADQALVAHQLEQRPLALDVQDGLQLARRESSGRGFDELPGRFHEVAVAGKPNRMPAPQPLLVKRGDLLQRVVLAPVRVARQIKQALQLAEYRHRARGTQGLLEVVERGHSLALKERTHGLGRESILCHVV